MNCIYIPWAQEAMLKQWQKKSMQLDHYSKKEYFQEMKAEVRLYVRVCIQFIYSFCMCISLGVTQKKLQRLFPCDTSMVVVLDDRSDVWSFSPNLIRIKPCRLFLTVKKEEAN